MLRKIIRVVPIQNLKSDALTIQAAEDWNRHAHRKANPAIVRASSRLLKNSLLMGSTKRFASV